MIPKRALWVFLLLTVIAPAAAHAHIVIVSPNGGEVYSAGDVVHIRWCIAVSHTLLNWDLRYNTALPGVDTACGNVTGGFEIIELDVPPTCTEAGGGICFLNPDPPCCMDYFWTVPDGIDSDQVKIKIRMDNAGTDYFDLSDAPFTITSSTSIPEIATDSGFTLEQNEPNPCASSTRIAYTLAREAPFVRLLVYDVHGRMVRRLIQGEETTGRHVASWDGTDQEGTPVPGGVYFYRLEDGVRSETRKLVVVR